MARGQSPLAHAQARTLRALRADASSPAASPETSVSVMAPPSDALETDRCSLSVAGPTEASVPGIPSAAPVGGASGGAALGVSSADSHPPGSVSGSGAPDDGTCAAADAPEVSSAAPGAASFTSVRWEDIEDIVTAGADRTVQPVQGSTQSHFLALARLVVDLNRRPPLGSDYELDRRLKAAESLSNVVDALAPVSRSPAPWEGEIAELRDDVASLEAQLATSEASRRREVDLRLKAKCLCNQASHERNAALEPPPRRLRLDHADAARQLVATNIALEQSSQAAAVLEQRCRRLDKSLADTSASIWSGVTARALPPAFVTFLEELGALQLVIPPLPAASGSFEASAQAASASSASSGGAAGALGSSTALTVGLSSSDDSDPVIPSTLHKSKGKAARQATSAAAKHSKPTTRALSPPQASSASVSSAPVSGIAVLVDSDVLSFVSVPSGSNPPFSPIPRTPTSPASSTASTTSFPSTPAAHSRVNPGTEASVSVEIDEDGGAGADEAASEASDVIGGVFSTPVVSQPRSDGRPTRAASAAAVLRSMAAAEVKAAPNVLVLGLTTPFSAPATTQAFVASLAATPDPAELALVGTAASAAVMTSALARCRVTNTHTVVLSFRPEKLTAVRQLNAPGSCQNSPNPTWWLLIG
ncbi:unnamed protein product [Phytophthora fragariaefolia]|uniref:Unnamed protein product n=1 Tax=Phytophthora fragariaefolia TaxID=1490495 RepID=A0A9W7D4K0_9STRA|nr:unnamed protein product [Phytophthora fragariaefolia]